MFSHRAAPPGLDEPEFETKQFAVVRKTALLRGYKNRDTFDNLATPTHPPPPDRHKALSLREGSWSVDGLDRHKALSLRRQTTAKRPQAHSVMGL